MQNKRAQVERSIFNVSLPNIGTHRKLKRKYYKDYSFKVLVNTLKIT